VTWRISIFASWIFIAGFFFILPSDTTDSSRADQHASRRMETRGWRLHDSDPVAPEAFQLNIESFHKALPVSLTSGLALYLDHTVCAVLETRKRAVAVAGGEAPVWCVWGRFGARVLTKVLVNCNRMFIGNRVLMNHPQGLYWFPSLRYSSKCRV